MTSTRGGSFCSAKCAAARLFGVMQIRRALRGESVTFAAVRKDMQPWRGVPSNVRAAADRPWPRKDSSAARRSARACTSRGTRFVRRSGIDVCFSKYEAMPTVFYNFAASRPGFLARNLPNSLARHGTAISAWPPGSARLVFLAVLLGRCYEPIKVPLAPAFPVFRATATKKSKKCR